MNLKVIEEELEIAGLSIGRVRRELKAAHEESRFNMFEPLCRRAETIGAKIEQLEEIVLDLQANGKDGEALWGNPNGNRGIVCNDHAEGCPAEIL
jgi:hypothetical protein